MANQDDERPLCTLGLPVSSIAGGSPLDADELRSLFLQTKNGHRFRDGRSSPVEPEGIEPSSKRPQNGRSTCLAASLVFDRQLGKGTPLTT